MTVPRNIGINQLWTASVVIALLAGCASGSSTKSGGADQPTPTAAASTSELPSPTRPILIFDADTAQAYEVLGEIDANLKDQRVYNYEGSKDQARDYLKRVAFAKYSDQLDAIINFRTVTAVGGGSFWGAMGAAYGAKNTDVRATGIAIHFKNSKNTTDGRASSASLAPPSKVSDANSTKSLNSISKDSGISDSMSTIDIQKRLIEVRYLTGKADGAMGNKTIEAIKIFQQNNGIPVTGKPDSETVGKLRMAR